MISTTNTPNKIINNEENPESGRPPSTSKNSQKTTLKALSIDEYKTLPTDLESFSRILLKELEKKDQLVNDLQTRLNEGNIEPSMNTDSLTPTNLGMSSFEELAQSKLIQLTKKNRSLQLQLSKSHSQNQQLRDQLSQTTQALEQLSLHPPTTSIAEPSKLHSPSPPSKSQQEFKRLKEQLQQMTQQLDEERSNQAILKFSIQKWQRIVEKETGEPISKWTSNMDGTGWKGRAQQITILKAKISALESKLFKKKDDSIQPCVQESIRLAQEKRRAQFAATLDENTQLKEKIAELTRKLEGLQARNHFLCLQEGNLKQKLQLVIQKATKDDHLIQLLQKELNYWKTSAIPATSQPSPKKSETRKVSSPPRPILDFTTPIPATAPTLLMSERERYESELQQLRTKLRIYQNEIQVLKQTLESVQEAKEEKWIKYLNDSQSQNFQIPKLAI